MDTYSYPGCQNCLVKMCCQNVCEEYRQHIFETTGMEIHIDRITLEESEQVVAMKSQEPITFKVGEDEYRVSIDIRGIM